jgi:hypothetical protein
LVAGCGVGVEACYACWPSGGAEDCCPAHCPRTLAAMVEVADCGSKWSYDLNLMTTWVIPYHRTILSYTELTQGMNCKDGDMEGAMTV